MITGLNHITLVVFSLDESLQFYEQLGFCPEVRWNVGAYLSLNELWLCLTLGRTEVSGDHSHLAFSVPQTEFSTVRQALIDSGVQRWQSNSSEGNSLYFLDPNGHKLEIHVGDLRSRLKQLESNPYDGLVWLNRNRSVSE